MGAAGLLSRIVDWLFRDRRTGRIVVAQWPNPPLWIFAGASLLSWALGPASPVAVRLVAATSLAVWAGDEVLRGVNPFRRCLGGAVLIGMLVRLAT